MWEFNKNFPAASFPDVTQKKKNIEFYTTCSKYKYKTHVWNPKLNTQHSFVPLIGLGFLLVGPLSRPWLVLTVYRLWVLRSELRSSAEATSAPNCWAISLAMYLRFVYYLKMDVKFNPLRIFQASMWYKFRLIQVVYNLARTALLLTLSGTFRPFLMLNIS